MALLTPNIEQINDVVLPRITRITLGGASTSAEAQRSTCEENTTASATDALCALTFQSAVSCFQNSLSIYLNKGFQKLHVVFHLEFKTGFIQVLQIRQNTKDHNRNGENNDI